MSADVNEQLRARYLSRARKTDQVILGSTGANGDDEVVHLREASAAVIDAYGKMGKDDPTRALGFLLANSIIDYGGQRVFADDDSAAILGMPFGDVKAITHAVLKLNGLSEDAADAAEKK